MDHMSVIRHHDWSRRFELLRELAGCRYPGYLIHEAALWSHQSRQWIFLPRRVSPFPLAYDEVSDERRGGNLVLVADEHFTRGKMSKFHVGKRTPERGFSSAKFVPGSNETLVLAIKSAEDDEQQTQDS